MPIEIPVNDYNAYSEIELLESRVANSPLPVASAEAGELHHSEVKFQWNQDKIISLFGGNLCLNAPQMGAIIGNR
jgi:hypothetical protein